MKLPIHCLIGKINVRTNRNKVIDIPIIKGNKS
jgi:hypothetical protein